MFNLCSSRYVKAIQALLCREGVTHPGAGKWDGCYETINRGIDFYDSFKRENAASQWQKDP